MEFFRFRQARQRKSEPLLGIFIKTVSADVHEVMAASSADCFIIDAENASFSRTALSECVFIARSRGAPVIIRLPDANEAEAQHALMIGADGVILPHCRDPASVARFAQFLRGAAVERAYSGVGRSSARRTMPWPEFSAAARREFLILAQLDEPEGFQAADAIAAVPGIDGIFLGLLTLQLSDRLQGEDARAALAAALAAAKARGLLVGISDPDPGHALAWAQGGADLLMISNDLGALAQGVEARLSAFRG
jgi:staphyloferrin B biosynthesis citrate synthase